MDAYFFSCFFIRYIYVCMYIKKAIFFKCQ